MAKFAGMVSPTSVSFTGIDGKNYIVSSGHPNIIKIREAMRATREAFASQNANSNDLWQELTDLADIKASIIKKSAGRVRITGEEVFFDNRVLHNSLTRRILWCLSENEDPLPYMRFLDNLMENPSKNAVDELFTFMENCNMGITDDGMILAYKRVRNNYYDIYSGTFRNMIGDTPSMPRNQVMDDKNQTCSAGLHFCSFGYLSSYGLGGTEQDRVMIIECHPKNIVSVPVDYNFAKVRCCEYKVVGEYMGDDLTDILSAKPVWHGNDDNFSQQKIVEKGSFEQFLTKIEEADYNDEIWEELDRDTLVCDLPSAVVDEVDDIITSLGWNIYRGVDVFDTLGGIYDACNGADRAETMVETTDTKSSDVISRVNRIVIEHLQISENRIHNDSHLFNDFGADELDVVELVMAIEEEFGVEISDEQMANIITVADLVRHADKSHFASVQDRVIIYPVTQGNETRWTAELTPTTHDSWKQTYARKRDARRGAKRVFGDSIVIIERDM